MGQGSRASSCPCLCAATITRDCHCGDCHCGDCHCHCHCGDCHCHCPVTLVAQDSLLPVPPPPSPPWGEASWEKEVSCSSREDLYSLLIDFPAYSPTGAALLIFCTPHFLHSPGHGAGLSKMQGGQNQCVLTLQHPGSPCSVLPKMQAQPWVPPRGSSTCSALIHYTSVSRRNPSPSCHS